MRSLVACAIAVVTLAALAPAAASGQSRRAPDLQVFRAPDGRFVIGYPRRDWQVLPGGGSVVATFGQKNGEAAVVVDYTKMAQALEPGEINDLFAELEGEDLTSRQPEAAGATPEIVNAGVWRVVVIKYSRAGLRGREQVVQYTVPAGQDMFRLICSAQAAQFAKYEPLFMAMIESFQSPAGPPGGARK